MGVVYPDLDEALALASLPGDVDGYISICGYGSLLSEKSARSTFPHLINFRTAKLTGFRRLFSVVGAFFFTNAIANLKTQVVPESLDGKPFTNPAVLCASYTDEEFFKFRCSEGREMYFQQYGEYNIHKIWRDDALPCRVYLRHCVLAAKNLGDEAYNNFLDHTFVADRKTTIRQYFEKMGTSIMDEEPPESLKTRYGG
ncbi:unnamed protein product [Trifolium pratense]|uniref:Uncharacterized protein n=1 Tax=Trifolium pratense TaxID=57577 RepID=A0ACB0KAP4_TRIPR|nr:unnamed protein product [Trifolium pratense]